MPGKAKVNAIFREMADAASIVLRTVVTLTKPTVETPVRRLGIFWFATAIFALLSAAISAPGAKAEQLNCSLLTDSLETNITLSLKTAETLLNKLNSSADPESALLVDALPQVATDYVNLTSVAATRISLVIDDLNAMEQIGAACIDGNHYTAVVRQAANANNIDQYLHEKFTSLGAEQSVFLTTATAKSLLGRAISHKKNVLGVLVAEGYFLR